MDDKERSDHPPGISPNFDLLPTLVHADRYVGVDDPFSLGSFEDFEDIINVLAETEPLAIYYDFVGVFEVGVVGQEVIGCYLAVVDQQVEGEV